MSSGLVGKLKRTFEILWKYKEELAEAILLLSAIIAEAAKKDNEVERDSRNASENSAGWFKSNAPINRLLVEKLRWM